VSRGHVVRRVWGSPPRLSRSATVPVRRRKLRSAVEGSVHDHPTGHTAAEERRWSTNIAWPATTRQGHGTGFISPATLDDVDRMWDRTPRRSGRPQAAGGMMPPVGIPRPDKDTYHGMLLLQAELTRLGCSHAAARLHRLNRWNTRTRSTTAQSGHRPGKYLPSDDSTSGFDNIAGALDISSTLVGPACRPRKISAWRSANPRDRLWHVNAGEHVPELSR
jgi:hypothetical protein